MTGRAYYIVFLVLVFAVPFTPAPEFWITQANYIGIGALVALGLVLLTGVAGLTSFGQAAFVGLGAYSSAYLTTKYGASPWLSLVLGLLITTASAYVIGRVTLSMSGHYLPLATISWGISLYYLFGGIEELGRYDGIAEIPAITLFGLDLGPGRRIYFLIWAILLAAAWCLRNMLNSRPGRALRSLKNGRILAEAMGADTARYKITIFVIAAGLASVSGWLYAHVQRSVNPTPFGLQSSLEYVIMVVMGGMGHVWGAILGSGIMLIVQDQLRVILPKLLGTGGNFEVIIFGMVLILLLRYAPDGLWPFLQKLAPAVRKKAEPVSTSNSLPGSAKPAAGETLLEIERLRKDFGGLAAVSYVGFRIRAGEVVGLIGPNGAGKSTIFNLITGVLPTSGGEVRFLGERIDTKSCRIIARSGIARTFQHVKLLPGMTVLENVALGAHQRLEVGLARAALRLDRKDEALLLKEAARNLERVGLGGHLHEDAASLPLGQQRLLEIARALCCDPKLLLLDEPAAGLRLKEKEALAKLLAELRTEGMGILLVEHDMDFVMGLADHLVVINFGTKIAEGNAREIQTNPAVLEAYLGGAQ